MDFMNDEIILVDKNDNIIGTGNKLQIHETGALHRAFSVFIFNNKKELLLQKRSFKKYHSPRLWSNTVCSHQRKGEGLDESVKRRLVEELGFSAAVQKIFKFTYKAAVGELLEHECDHVFAGVYNGEVKPNPDEVDAYKWFSMEKLEEDIQAHPEKYTAWFKILMNDHLNKIIGYLSDSSILKTVH